LGCGPLTTLFGEDVFQADVEVGMGDWDLFEVLNEFRGHY